MPLFGPNLKQMRAKGDVQGLMNALKHKDPGIRVEAIRALRELGHVQGILEALRNEDPEVSMEATRALTTLGRMDELVLALKSKHPEVRIAAIESLSNRREPTLAEPLIEVVATDTVETVQRKALDAIGSFGMIDAGTWVSVGARVLQAGEYRGALYCFQKAMAINPRDREMVGSIGDALMNRGRYEDALDCYERVIQIDPADARGWERKAICLNSVGKEEEVIVCCNKALEIDQRLLGTRVILGIIYRKRGDYARLASFAQETVQFAPESMRARVMLAEALMYSGKLNEAKSELEKALEILQGQEWMEPEDLARIHRELGLLYAMKGEKESALAEFQRTFEFSRDKIDGHLQEAYEILDTLGLALRGTPQDRRARLTGLARLRGEGYKTALERLVGDTAVSELCQFATGVGGTPGGVSGMLKGWSTRHFVEFIRIRPRPEIEALIENAGQVMMTLGKES